MLYDDLEGWVGAVGGSLKREEINIYIYIYIHTHTHTHTHIADSLCCTAETNTTLQSNYIPIETKTKIMVHLHLK